MAVLIVVLVVVGVAVLVSGGYLVATRARGRADLSEEPGAAPPKGAQVETPTERVIAAGAPEAVRDAPGPVAEAPAPAAEAPGEAPPPAPEEAPLAAPPRLEDRLGKARGLFGSYLAGIRGRSAIGEETWDELEEALILADVGLPVTSTLLGNLRDAAKQERIRDPKQLLAALREQVVATLETGDRALARGADGGRPTVWLFVGVNGVGKTTTIGKVAAAEAAAGRKVVLAAGDTFRAAAADQLQVWAERVGAHIVRGAEGGDPSAVIFDAVQAAAARKADLVLADTAGRLHTKANLMDELRKVRRVAAREPAQLTEVLLVIDATTGQNGLVQAREFADATEITGVALTKLDGTAKGGIVIAVAHELGVPVKLVGVGEAAADLIAFDPKEFVEAVLD